MAMQIETIYYLENPEEGIKKWVTESQLKYENIIKDVFGVALVNDLPIMIHYNKKFQECICNVNNIPPSQIRLDMIFRVASKEDLLEFKKEYLAEQNTAAGFIAPPFDSVIQLHDGLFRWDESNSSYTQLKEN